MNAVLVDMSARTPSRERHICCDRTAKPLHACTDAHGTKAGWKGLWWDWKWKGRCRGSCGGWCHRGTDFEAL